MSDTFLTTSLLAKAKAGVSLTKRELSRNTETATMAFREAMDDLSVGLANHFDALEDFVVKFIGSEDNRRIIRDLDIEISSNAPLAHLRLPKDALGLARVELPMKRATRVGRTLRALDDDVRHSYYTPTRTSHTPA